MAAFQDGSCGEMTFNTVHARAGNLSIQHVDHGSGMDPSNGTNKYVHAGARVPGGTPMPRPFGGIFGRAVRRGIPSE